MNIRAELIQQWDNEWVQGCPHVWPITRLSFISNKAAAYGAEQMKEHCARLCESLRVGGDTEWTDAHLDAVRAINDCAAAIRSTPPP